MISSQTVDLLLGIAAAVGVATTLFSSACFFWVLRRPRNLPDFTPPVTIFKPLKGLDEELEENLASFFDLDYPTYQLLFCVADPSDPAADVVRRLLAEHPDRDARLVAGCPRFGLNPKVESLAAMEPYRRHDVLLISDSNVRVRPTYLRETAGYLAEPSVGMVTNLFAGTGEVHAAAALENLQINGFIAGGIAMASMLGVTCVVGKSMMLRGSVLDAIGGFASVRNLLAEDQAMGMMVRKAGYSICLSHHVIQNVNRRRGFTWFLNRHSRWFKIRRRLALPAFAAEPLSSLATIGLVWAFSGDSGIAWGGLLCLIGLGMARDAAQTRRLRGSFPKIRHLIYSPIKDLLLLPLWFDALLNSHVQWRGNRFYVGRLTRLTPDATPRGARRRSRLRGGPADRRPDATAPPLHASEGPGAPSQE